MFCSSIARVRLVKLIQTVSGKVGNQFRDVHGPDAAC